MAPPVPPRTDAARLPATWVSADPALRYTARPGPDAGNAPRMAVGPVVAVVWTTNSVVVVLRKDPRPPRVSRVTTSEFANAIALPNGWRSSGDWLTVTPVAGTVPS